MLRATPIIASVTQTEPGWYPDPHGVGVARWYDGTKWTAITAGVPPRHLAPDSRPTLGEGWLQLARVLKITLAVDLLVAVVASAQSRRLHDFLVRLRTGGSTPGDASEAQTLDRITALLYWTSLALAVVTFVLFVTWLYRAHRSNAVDAAHLRHGSGWAIGGWFVPILSLWRPAQMVQDVHRGASQDHTDSPLVIVWWIAYLCSMFVANLGDNFVVPADATGRNLLDQLIDGATFSTVVHAVFAGLTALTLVVVHRLSRVVLAARPPLVTGR